jgi:serine/threonine protein phosphatase 1
MPRLLAIGDIHGCSRALDALLLAVSLAPDDRIVMLGDYIDRGPDSRGVMNRVMALHATGRLVALRGNHEIIMLNAPKASDSLKFWLAIGGREALESYSVSGKSGRLQDIPDSHWQFLKSACVDWYELANHFFVHANVNPDLPLDQQPSSMLHWEHFNQWTVPHCSGKMMICGHSEQRSGWPLVLKHAICIDTWAYGGGWLTCLDVGNGRVWQANQRGETRIGWVDEGAPR